MLGSKISNTLENNSVAASFMRLKLRRWENARLRTDYDGVVTKIMCSLEG